MRQPVYEEPPLEDEPSPERIAELEREQRMGELRMAGIAAIIMLTTAYLMLRRLGWL